eukprot:173784-Pyramimonas_sp.AAC.1
MERANRSRVLASRVDSLLDSEQQESVDSVLQVAASTGETPRAVLSEARALQRSLNIQRRAKSRADQDVLDQYDKDTIAAARELVKSCSDGAPWAASALASVPSEFGCIVLSVDDARVAKAAVLLRLRGVAAARGRRSNL